MIWIPIGAWVAAVVIGVVVLGYAAYEIRWKALRLREDLNGVLALQDRIFDLQRNLSAVSRRLARVDVP